MSVFNAFVRSRACGRVFHLSFADERTELACCTGNVARGRLCAKSQNGLPLQRAALTQLADAARQVDKAAFGSPADFGPAHQALLKALDRAEVLLQG